MVQAPIPLAEIRSAAERVAGRVVRPPLVRLNRDGPPEIWLKLECLQPIGSFKIRGAASALARMEAAELADGVWTASAGNMAQGVAWFARQLGVPCSVVVPETAPEAKKMAIRQLGAEIVEATVEAWFEVFETRRYPGMSGYFLHPFSDPAVIAGSGTIGLEILEDLPETDAVIAPFGGGGLACGIASALRALAPGTATFASEVETGAPLAASFEADTPTTVEHTVSFVDGIGGPSINPEMWELSRELLAGSIVVGLDEAAAAVRRLVERNHVVAEGAGGTSVAAALTGAAGDGTIVCVVSGGNIDTETLLTILRGDTP